MELTGAEIVWECLIREGVDLVFGYPGGAILPAYDPLLDSSIRHVLVRHEQLASVMAEVYGRLTGKPGVAIGQGAAYVIAWEDDMDNNGFYQVLARGY